MKTDKIFYTLFQAFPDLLFQLLGQSPELAQNYQFQSVEIKELAFRLDGVFLPDDNSPEQPIYFLEVQFQKDPNFYWRFFTEIILYLNQYKPHRQWQAIVLWGKPSLDVELPLAYELFQSRLQRIYLDSLPQPSSSLALGIIQLIFTPEANAPAQTQALVSQTRQQISDVNLQQDIIELIEKVITYKFPQKSRQELEQMFTLTDWQQTRFYQDAKKEGEEIGEQRGEQRGKQIGEQIGEQKAKLETVPLLLKLGLTPEQIALELKLDLEQIQAAIANQNH
jgi:predicted transposase/invertase (TIGR01784 family)